MCEPLFVNTDCHAIIQYSLMQDPWSQGTPCPMLAGALGGRLDHTLANLNALYSFPHLDVVLWGEGNLVRLLPAGVSHIKPCLDLEGPSCGLVPLGGPVTGTSEGLRWNLENLKVSIGRLDPASRTLKRTEHMKHIVHSSAGRLWVFLYIVRLFCVVG
jgi:thiamine pyrophosphokinase